MSIQLVLEPETEQEREEFTELSKGFSVSLGEQPDWQSAVIYQELVKEYKKILRKIFVFAN
jgi:hypothetical protein